MNRDEVNAHSGGILPVHNHGDMYRAFVSYR